jgi:hypothetical protein
MIARASEGRRIGGRIADRARPVCRTAMMRTPRKLRRLHEVLHLALQLLR